MALVVAERRTIRQFARFLVVGAINTAFGYAVFATLVVLGVAPMPSLVATYVVGVVFNFMTTGRYVFDHRGYEPFLRFVAAYVVIWLFNAALFKAVEWLGVRPLVAQALCIPVVAVFSFALFRLRVFVERA